MDFNYKYYQENSDQSNELLEYTMYGGKYDIELVNNSREGCKNDKRTYNSKTVESFGVFRKLQTPAAPHPGYSISKDRRDGDIQALLGAAVKL